MRSGLFANPNRSRRSEYGSLPASKRSIPTPAQLEEEFQDRKKLEAHELKKQLEPLMGNEAFLEWLDEVFPYPVTFAQLVELMKAKIDELSVAKTGAK